MSLTAALPREQILAVVPDACFPTLNLAELDHLAVMEPETVRGFGFAAWDHALSSGAHDNLDPQGLAAAINAGDALLIRHVERVLGRRALFDLHYAIATRPGDDEPFAIAALAHLYPNHVHIGDIKLLDPNRPRAGVRWVDQTHESLRLFPVFLENLRAGARALNAEKLTLTAANRPLQATFERHGFVMADTIGAATVVAMDADVGFPMELRLD